MLEQQVRLSDKEAMVRAKLRNFRPYRKKIKMFWNVVKKKRKKINKSFFIYKTTKKFKRLNYSQKVYF
jgi:hypothetical protein